MATPTYGTTAPGAIEPFSIESTLANIVGTNNPAAAGGALDLYQLQNQVSRSNYGYDLAQQHEFAKKQLQQQLLETQMKEFHNIAKLPGGAQFLASGGIPGMDFGGAPGALTGLAEAGDVAQGAENFQKGMAGFASGSEGGLLTDPSMIPGLPPNFRGVLTDNAKVRAAQIDANAKITSAGMHVPKPPTMSVPFKFGVTDKGEPITGQIPIPMNASQADIDARLAQARNVYNTMYPPGSGVPGATPPGGTPAIPTPQTARQSQPNAPPVTPTAPQPPPPTTGLPRAPATTTAAPVAASPTFITDAKTQQLAQRGMQYLTPQAKLDVGANIQGSVMPVVQLKGGGVGYVGKSGTIHTLPPPRSKQ